MHEWTVVEVHKEGVKRPKYQWTCSCGHMSGEYSSKQDAVNAACDHVRDNS